MDIEIDRKIDATAKLFLLVENRQQTHDWTLIGWGANVLSIGVTEYSICCGQPHYNHITTTFQPRYIPHFNHITTQDVYALTQMSSSILQITSFKLKLEKSAFHF